MGSLYVFDGPEKSGKTTVIREIAYKLLDEGFGVTVRRWGPIVPDDRVYGPEILQAANMPDRHITLWDRSWAAEHVYAKLLGRDRRSAQDPWLVSWLHDRPLYAIGRGTIVLAPNTQWSIDRRDLTDIPCDPEAERKAFIQYGFDNRWDLLVNSFPGGAKGTANAWLWTTFYPSQEKLKGSELKPPAYFGPPDSPVVIVGTEDANDFPGSWGPFSSRASQNFGREFGNHVNKIGWALAGECLPSALRTGRKQIIAMGEAAALWVKNFVVPPPETEFITMRHPAYAYRNGKASVTKRDKSDYATLAQRVIRTLEVNRNGKVQQVSE